jgi:hypothetical protein
VTIASTPRPVPSLVGPALAGSAVLAVALPVFLLAGWPLAAWLLAAVLWGGGQALGALLARVPAGVGTAASGVVGVAMLFRAAAVGIVLIAVTASDAAVGLAAAGAYALAYTLELALSLTAFFAGEAR